MLPFCSFQLSISALLFFLSFIFPTLFHLLKQDSAAGVTIGPNWWLQDTDGRSQKMFLANISTSWSVCVCVCVCVHMHARACVSVCVCVYSSLLLALELNAQLPFLGRVPFKLQLAPVKMTLAPISYVWLSIIKNFPTADDFYFMNTWKYMSHIRVLTSFYLSSENSFIKKCHLFYTIMLCEGLFIALWKLGNVVFLLTFRKIVKH